MNWARRLKRYEISYQRLNKDSISHYLYFRESRHPKKNPGLRPYQEEFSKNREYNIRYLETGTY